MVEVDKKCFVLHAIIKLCLNIFMQKCDKSMSGPMLWLFQMHEIPKVYRCCKLFTDVFIKNVPFLDWSWVLYDKNVTSLWFKRQDTVRFSKTNNCEFKWNQMRSSFSCSMQIVQNISLYASECETLCLVWSMHYRCAPHDFVQKKIKF